MMKYADNNERPGILNQLYFSMAQKLLPPKPKAAPDHLSALQVQYLGDGNIGGGNVGDGNVDDGNVVMAMLVMAMLVMAMLVMVAVVLLLVAVVVVARASLAGRDDGVGDHDEKDLTSQSNTKVSPSQRFKPGL